MKFPPTSSFNKRLEDFNGNLRKYNDYLEEVEFLLFNLINDIDVQQTNERIEKFRLENRDLIASNQSKEMMESKAITHRLKREREEKQLRREAYVLQTVEIERAKKAEQAHLLEELKNSDKSTDEILKAYHESKKRVSEKIDLLPSFIEEIDESSTDTAEFDPMDHEYEDSMDIEIGVYQDPWTLDLASNKAARGAGYMAEWSHTRAIRSSFVHLFAK